MDLYYDYFSYLRGRSRLGLLYRRLLLYPRISRYFSGRVLDVGCGIGDYLDFRPGSVGVDVNPHAVSWCLQKGLDCRLMTDDRLPFDGESFDGVVLDNVLEHLVDPMPILSEIQRVLVSRGRLVIGIPGLKGYSCDPDHKKFYSEEDLVETLHAYGFEMRTMFHAPMKNSWLNARLPQYCIYGIFERI